MGFYVCRHLGLLGCNIAIMKRLLPLFILSSFLFGQDVLLLKSGKNYKGRFITKDGEKIIFRLEGEKNINAFSINDVDIIMTIDGDLYYPFDMPSKLYNPPRTSSLKPLIELMIVPCGMLLVVLLVEALGLPTPGM